MLALESTNGYTKQSKAYSESAEYLAKREDLRLSEIGLMCQRERVAEPRRDLPTGPTLEDYKVIEVPVDLDSGDTPTRTARPVDFTGAGRPLVIITSCTGTKRLI